MVYAWRDENSVYVADEHEKLIYGNVYFENPDRAIKFFVDLETRCGKRRALFKKQLKRLQVHCLKHFGGFRSTV